MARRRLTIAAAVTGATLALLTPAVLARGVRVRLDEGIQTLLAGGESLKLGGKVLEGVRGARVELEQRAAHGWKAVAHAPLRAGAFALSWRPPADRR